MGPINRRAQQVQGWPSPPLLSRLPLRTFSPSSAQPPSPHCPCHHRPSTLHETAPPPHPGRLVQMSGAGLSRAVAGRTATFEVQVTTPPPVHSLSHRPYNLLEDPRLLFQRPLMRMGTSGSAEETTYGAASRGLRWSTARRVKAPSTLPSASAPPSSPFRLRGPLHLLIPRSPSHSLLPPLCPLPLPLCLASMHILCSLCPRLPPAPMDRSCLLSWPLRSALSPGVGPRRRDVWL